MATPYGYYGNTLTDIQTGINQAAQIEQQRMAAQEQARAQRFNALMEMRSQQARNQAALQQSAQQNAFNMAGLQQEERIAGLDRAVRERELAEARKQREFAEIQRQREAQARRDFEAAEAERGRTFEATEAQKERAVPDPRILIERERNEADRRGINALSEAAARQANLQLRAARANAEAMYEPEWNKRDTWTTWESTAKQQAREVVQRELDKQIGLIGAATVQAGASVQYNPATQQFEAVPIEPFPTAGIPGAASPVPRFAPPPSGSTFNQVPPTSPLYGQPLPPRTMRPGPQTMAPASEYPIGQFGPSQTMAPGSSGTIRRWRVLPDGSIVPSQ